MSRSGTDYVLERTQVVPGHLETVFSFFEDPMNLEALTPPWLRFEVTSATDDHVRQGTEIAYRLRWQGIPVGWRSRISEYEKDRYFADEMLRGPYASWHHRHDFAAVPSGVEIRDRVTYRLPMGPVGRVVHRLVVRAQLEAIFDYRRDAASRIFAEAEARRAAQAG